MRICLVSREYPPFFGGGIGTYNVQFSRALAAAGHQVTIVTVSDDGCEHRQRHGNLTIVRLPFIHRHDWSGPHPAIATPLTRAAFHTFAAVSVFALQAASALPRLHDELGFDIVEAPDTEALSWFVLNARRTAGVWARSGPAILTCIHSPTDWIAHWNRRPLRHPQLHELVSMERDCIRWSDGLVCPSKDVAQWAMERCNLAPGSVAVIPYPLGDLELAAHAAAASPAAPCPAHRACRILFASRLEPRKGIDTLLAAFARALQQGADLHLDLAGQDVADPRGFGSFGANHLAALPQRLRQRIVLHGKVPPQRIAELQQQAHAIAIPSPMDNFPYACMEAMSRGAVVVAARAGGMARMIVDGQSGILFQPGDAQSCAEALLRAARLSTAEAAQMGAAAARRMLELCGNQAVIARRLEHYQHSIDRRARHLAALDARPPRRALLVGAGNLDRDAAQRLTAAITTGECDFAHGWLQSPAGDLCISSTPRLEHPTAMPVVPGPLALAEDVAAHPSIAPSLQHSDDPSSRHCPDPLALSRTLCSAGFSGGIIPEVLTTVSAPPRRPHQYRPPLPLRAARRATKAALKVMSTVRQRGLALAAEYHLRAVSAGRGTQPRHPPGTSA
jgi:glycosyltransferase involved in cell wall biosynthesis